MLRNKQALIITLISVISIFMVNTKYAKGAGEYYVSNELKILFMHFYYTSPTEGNTPSNWQSYIDSLMMQREYDIWNNLLYVPITEFFSRYGFTTTWSFDEAKIQTPITRANFQDIWFEFYNQNTVQAENIWSKGNVIVTLISLSDGLLGGKFISSAVFIDTKFLWWNSKPSDGRTIAHEVIHSFGASDHKEQLYDIMDGWASLDSYAYVGFDVNLHWDYTYHFSTILTWKQWVDSLPPPINLNTVEVHARIDGIEITEATISVTSYGGITETHTYGLPYTFAGWTDGLYSIKVSATKIEGTVNPKVTGYELQKDVFVLGGADLIEYFDLQITSNGDTNDVNSVLYFLSLSFVFAFLVLIYIKRKKIKEIL